MNSPYVSLEKREKRGLADYGISVERLKMLEDFVNLVKFNYNILNTSSLKFFKDWLLNDLNAQIPKSRYNRPVPKPEDNQYRKDFAEAARKAQGEPEPESSSSESKCDDYEDKITYEQDPNFEERVEFESDCDDQNKEGDAVTEGDAAATKNGPEQKMENNDRKTTDEEQIEIEKKKCEGVEAMNRENYELAVTHFTDGILLDNSSTILFVKRATAFVKLSKGNDAIKDCMNALRINPDSAAAYRVLGKAQRIEGLLQDARLSLEEAQKIDFDEEIQIILEEIKDQVRELYDVGQDGYPLIYRKAYLMCTSSLYTFP